MANVTELNLKVTVNSMVKIKNWKIEGLPSSEMWSFRDCLGILKQQRSLPYFRLHSVRNNFLLVLLGTKIWHRNISLFYMYYMYSCFDTWNLLPSWRLFGHPEAAEKLGPISGCTLWETIFSRCFSGQKFDTGMKVHFICVTCIYTFSHIVHLAQPENEFESRGITMSSLGSWLFDQSIAQSQDKKLSNNLQFANF